MPQRRPDIDWLRVLATYLLFVFHVGKVFDPAPFYHVRNAELSFGLLVACGFISLWHMPLFFLLAGWSAASSLATRGVGGFARERMRRLAVPLLAGCVLLAPVIKYLELRSGLDLNHAGLRVAPALQPGFETVIPGGLPTAAPFDESFLEFLPTFFTGLDRFTWSHLWFVAYLLTLTIVYLPAFAWLLRRRDCLQSVGAWVLYVPAAPLALVQLTLRERWPGIQNLYDDWANVAYYSIYLLSGFILACQPALDRLVEREWKRALGIGLATTFMLLLAVLGVIRSPAVLLAGSGVAGWCLVVALLGLGRRALTRTGPALAYLSESAFPVYVLHQSAIVIPGFFIVGLPLGIAAKFVLLFVVSAGVTLAVYQWGVRPFAMPRVLLGMKPKSRPVLRASMSPASVTGALLAIGLAVAGPVRAATPLGTWYAEGGAARVRIEACGDALCGRVVWLRSPLDEDGCALRDRNNPDPALRTRPIEGLEILRGLEPYPDGTWGDGTVYDPNSGRTYACRLALEGDDRLRLRGYLAVPMLGRTTTWIRVGSEQRACAGD
jgi:uncharacterized protein (DUF2147 family)